MRISDRSIRKHRPDYQFITPAFILLILGLIIIYSISPVLSHKLLGDVGRNYFLWGQLLHIGVGLTGFLIASNIHYSKWQKFLPVLIVITGLSLLLLALPGTGVSRNGATRWVSLGPITYQPAEIIKLVSIIYLAGRFSQDFKDKSAESARRTRITLGLLLVLSAIVLFWQKDMGTMIVIAAILFAQFYSSGVSIKHVSQLLLAGLSVGIGSILLFPHRISRLVTYFNPGENTTSSGYHLNQALIAIGSGGILGLGIGKSVQIYGYLPEAANDSIFAIIGETFGFLGSLVVLGLFAWLVYRGFKISMDAPNRQSQLIAVGIVVWIASQTLINMAAMLGLVPLTGIPLPFLSYGGTSLVMLMTAAGILVNISKYTRKGQYADSFGWRGNRRPHHAYTNNR